MKEDRPQTGRHYVLSSSEETTTTTTTTFHMISIIKILHIVDGEEKSRGYYSLRVRGLDIRNDSRPSLSGLHGISVYYIRYISRLLLSTRLGRLVFHFSVYHGTRVGSS
jgi:hypothetical protein